MMKLSISTVAVVLLWVSADAYREEARARPHSQLKRERNGFHSARGHLDIEELRNAHREERRRSRMDADDVKRLKHFHHGLRSRDELRAEALENINNRMAGQIRGWKGKDTDPDIKDLLRAHNGARKKVQPTASNMLKLKWNANLAKAAQAHADNCTFVHSVTSNGENLYATSGSLSMTEGVQAWDAEKANYDYDNNTCEVDKVCGHYTQVVWASSQKVGCGWSFCPTLAQCGLTDCSNWNYLVCQYSPAGNYVGEKPYESGDSCASCSSCCKNKLCTKADCDDDDGSDDGGDDSNGGDDSSDDGSDGGDDSDGDGDDDGGDDDGSYDDGGYKTTAPSTDRRYYHRRQNLRDYRSQKLIL